MSFRTDSLTGFTRLARGCARAVHGHWARIALVAAGLCLSPPAMGSDASSAQMRSLDEQVQEIKSEVLSIAAELGQLEEKLLYPSDTHLAVFVSVAEEETARLDWLRLQIDDELVTHHIYSFKELEALAKGGVQRIYTGNLVTGEHRLEVSMSGSRPGGGQWSGSQSFRLQKGVGPKVVEIELDPSASDDASIRIEEP